MHLSVCSIILVLTTFPALLLAINSTRPDHYPHTYIIQEAEKPKGGNGLSVEGAMRGECIRELFGPDKGYKFVFMMAPKIEKNCKERRPYDTIAHIAQKYDLEIDQTCERDDIKCVLHVISSRKMDGDVLLCWHPARIGAIVKGLGVRRQKTKWSGKNYNTYWALTPPYSSYIEYQYECPGLKGEIGGH